MCVFLLVSKENLFFFFSNIYLLILRCNVCELDGLIFLYGHTDPRSAVESVNYKLHLYAFIIKPPCLSWTLIFCFSIIFIDEHSAVRDSKFKFVHFVN